MNTLAFARSQSIPVQAPPWARWRVAVAYRWRHGRWPSLDRPVRFTEWVQWRKLNDRRLDLALLTDKAHAKQIAETRLPADCVIPTLWLGGRLPEVAPWPIPFVVKANHGCNQFVIVRTGTDHIQAKKVAPSWLDKAYGGWLDEWHYRAAQRLILVEPYIGGAKLPLDYKVYVFAGRAETVQLHTGRGASHRWTQFDRNWQPLSNSRLIGSRRRALPISSRLPKQWRLAGTLFASTSIAKENRCNSANIAFIQARGSIPSNPTRLT